jgi:lysozyme
MFNNSEEFVEATERAIEFIKKHEGCRLKAYLDRKGPTGRWTVGYGATGPSIGAYTEWTQEQAEADLRERCIVLARLITQCVRPRLSQNQFNALVSFVYNVGITNFRGSGFLKLINEGHFEDAANRMLLWNKVDGAVSQGLVVRREAEREMFLEGLEI